jgi:translation initiation factor IF-2
VSLRTGSLKPGGGLDEWATAPREPADEARDTGNREAEAGPVSLARPAGRPGQGPPQGGVRAGDDARRASPDRVSGGERREERSATVSKTPPPFASARRARPASHDAATFTSGMMGTPKRPRVRKPAGRAFPAGHRRRPPPAKPHPGRGAAVSGGVRGRPARAGPGAGGRPGRGGRWHAPSARGGGPAGGRSKRASRESRSGVLRGRSPGSPPTPVRARLHSPRRATYRVRQPRRPATRGTSRRSGGRRA